MRTRLARFGQQLSEFVARMRPSDVRAAQRGQGLVEYGLILILVAIVVIVILSVVGAQTNNAFSNISNGLSQ
jgi:pilus assembly protein Flp/PilA